MCKVNLCNGYSNAFMWGLKIIIRSEWIDCVNADLTFLNILIDSQSIFCFFYQYSGDQDDKVWLYENQHMPATGGKTYMLILEDIKDLGKEDDYRWKEHCFISLHLNVIMYCKQTFICLQEIFTKGLQEHHHRQCLCRKN